MINEPINLVLIKWNKERDLPCINAWHAMWGSKPHPEWFFPEDVFIVPGVCSGAYYKTNSGLAYIENIVSNRECPSKIRQAGLKLLSDYIAKKAKEDGFKILVGWTDHPTVSNMAHQVGSKVSEHKFATLWLPLWDKGTDVEGQNFIDDFIVSPELRNK